MFKKLLLFAITIFLFVNCRPVQETEQFWNNISLNSKLEPFVFVFSNTEISTCAEHGQPKLEEVLSGAVNGIDASTVNGVMMYPSISDPQYSNIAEELKFLFDQNGNNTLETYPAYVNNLICYNTDSLGWHSSIINQINGGSPKIKLGIDASESVGTLKVYVRGSYSSNISSDHSIAVYAYRKEELANQTTSSGTELFTMKNKVISSLTPTVGKLLDGSQSEEIKEIFTLELDGENLGNLGIVAVVYELENNKPVSVINSISLENL